MVPEGDWFCPLCINSQVAELDADAVTSGLDNVG